jgi:ATP-dependent protease ClpP protease subunit
MEEVEFNVYEDFSQPLADRFVAFMGTLTKPCIVSIDIESHGGDAWVLMEMGALIAQKKSEGYVFSTNVENFAYSCGLFLFLIGDIKTASDTARFMFHSAGFTVDERLTSTDLREMLDIVEECDAFVEELIAENTNLQPGMYEILKKNDNFLNKEDLIFLGFMEREYELN